MQPQVLNCSRYLWTSKVESLPAARCRLLCFPHAGGSSAMFRPWSGLCSGLEIWTVNLPGRGGRLHETPVSNLDYIVEELAHTVNSMRGMPVALFGHSVGALIAFEVARKQELCRGFEPVHLFVSGCRGPAADPLPSWNVLTDDELVDQLQRLGGMTTNRFDDAELIACALPAIRADLEIAENYRHRSGQRLRCPVTALGGLLDPFVSEPQLKAWSAECAGPFSAALFAGGHFFVKESEAGVLRTVSHMLTLQGIL